MKVKKISYGPVDSQVKSIKSIDNIIVKYYISLSALDKPGVLKNITEILNQNGISVESITQKTSSENEAVPIIIVTHETEEKNIKKAMKTINSFRRS